MADELVGAEVQTVWTLLQSMTLGKCGARWAFSHNGPQWRNGSQMLQSSREIRFSFDIALQLNFGNLNLACSVMQSNWEWRCPVDYMCWAAESQRIWRKNQCRQTKIMDSFYLFIFWVLFLGLFRWHRTHTVFWISVHSLPASLSQLFAGCEWDSEDRTNCPHLHQHFLLMFIMNT